MAFIQRYWLPALSPEHIVQSSLLGADVATLPYSVMLQLFKHPLTDIGIEKFLSDWNKNK